MILPGGSGGVRCAGAGVGWPVVFHAGRAWRPGVPLGLEGLFDAEGKLVGAAGAFEAAEVALEDFYGVGCIGALKEFANG